MHTNSARAHYFEPAFIVEDIDILSLLSLLSLLSSLS